MTERQQADASARVAETLRDVLETGEGGDYINITDAVSDVGRALQLLGNADASTPMGALEAHGAVMLEASENIASGLHAIADAISEITTMTPGVELDGE
jgi:hypothetical protein